MKVLLGLSWILYAAMQAQSGTIPDESIAYSSQLPYQPQSAYNPTLNYNSKTQQSHENIYKNSVAQNPQSNAPTFQLAANQATKNDQQQSYPRQQQYLVQQQLQSFSGTQQTENQQQSFATRQRDSAISQQQFLSGTQYGSENKLQQSLPEKQHTSINSQLQSFTGTQYGSSNQQQQSFPSRQQASINLQQQSVSGTQYSSANQQQQSIPERQYASINSQLQSGIQQGSGQQSYSGIHRTLETNPRSVKNTHNEPVFQYNVQSNIASDVTNNKPAFITDIKPVQQQTVVPNTPQTYNQNSYNSQANPSQVSNQYRNENTQSAATQYKESTEEKKSSQYPTLDLVDTKSKTARKIPLVLITIQKNKNVLSGDKDKTNVKNQSINANNEREKYGSQIDYSNVPLSSNKNSEPALNIGTTLNVLQNNYNAGEQRVVPNKFQTLSLNAHQNNYNAGEQRVEQNTFQAPSLNTQQNYAQYQTSSSDAVQGSEQFREQINNVPLNQYRYPVLAGKKLESSEWKPVDKYANRRQNIYNQNSAVHNQNSQLTTSQQNALIQNQQKNLGYNSGYASSLNSATASPQNIATQYNNVPTTQGLPQQYATNNNNYPRQQDSNQIKKDNVNYQVTSFVSQANIGSGYSPAATNVQKDESNRNYFAYNNAQGSKDTTSNTAAQGTQATYFQGNNGNEQYSVQGDSAKYSVTAKNDQRQPNSYQVEGVFTLPLTQRGNEDALNQNAKKNNVLQSTSYLNANANANYNQVSVQDNQNKFNSNNSPLQQNANQNFANPNQGSNSGVARNNQQQYFSGNSQINSAQNSKISTENTRTNNLGGTSVNQNADRQRQQNYDTNSYITQSQINNNDQRYGSQNPVSVTVDNSGVSQITNYAPTQQLSINNVAQSNQQAKENSLNSVKNIQNSYETGYRTIQPNNQESQGNHYRSSIETPTSNVNKVNQNQDQIQNTRVNAQNYYSSNQGNRNNAVQRDQNIDNSNYGQSTVNFNENRNSNYQQAKINPPFLAQNVLPSSGSYGSGQSGSSSQAENSGLSQNTATNYQNTQKAFDTSIRNQNFVNSQNVPVSNYNSGTNNYQSANYGSSETKNSVIGTKPNQDSNNQAVNAHQQQQYTAASNIQSKENKVEDNYSQNPSQAVDIAYSEPLDSSSIIGKDADDEDQREAPPEALLLVLVSAKRSAIESHSNKEKDEMEEGYESAPEELVELLSEDANRQMIIESFHEATNGAYREGDEVLDDLEEAVEDNDDDKQYDSDDKQY